MISKAFLLASSGGIPSFTSFSISSLCFRRFSAIERLPVLKSRFFDPSAISTPPRPLTESRMGGLADLAEAVDGDVKVALSGGHGNMAKVLLDFL